jgi:phosphonate C-P lyase system protein PhnG
MKPQQIKDIQVYAPCNELLTLRSRIIYGSALYSIKAMSYDPDYVLCECALEPLQELVSGLEQRHRISIIKDPSVCLTMIRTEDSLEKQEFYLGEALTTECEVDVDGAPGYGICLGEEPVRGYCIAVLDALRHSGASGAVLEIEEFIGHHGRILSENRLREFNLTLRSQVDFKLMEQE